MEKTSKQGCRNCGHLCRSVGLWCGNQEAIVVNGSNAPIHMDCNYWASYWDLMNNRFGKNKEWVPIPV